MDYGESVVFDYKQICPPPAIIMPTIQVTAILLMVFFMDVKLRLII